MDAKNLENWIDLYSDDLLRFAKYRLGDESMAQDMVQDTFIAAYENLDQFKGDSNPKTWLARILRNKIVDFFRSAYYRNTIFEGQPSEDEGAESQLFDKEHWTNAAFESPDWEKDEKLMDQAEFKNLFQQCLNHLPPLWRDILAAKYFGSEKGKDISQEFQISTSNYWQIVHRAKLSLKNCLQDYWKSWAYWNLLY